MCMKVVHFDAIFDSEQTFQQFIAENCQITGFLKTILLLKKFDASVQTMKVDWAP